MSIINKNLPHDYWLGSDLIPPLTINDILIQNKVNRAFPISSNHKFWDYDPNKKVYFLELEMAGFSKEKTFIKLSNISSPYVSISSSRVSKGIDMKFSKEIYLPTNCDYSTLSAKMENGILTLSIQIANPQSFDKLEIPIS